MGRAWVAGVSFVEIGDRVRFYSADGGSVAGIVEKLNPKRAKVKCGDVMWSVPYARHGATNCLER